MGLPAGTGSPLGAGTHETEGDIFSAACLDTVRRLSDEVFLLPGVDRPCMKSLWAPAVRWIPLGA